MINWTKLGAILAVLIPLMTGAFWTAQNLVLAEDFSQYQQEQDLRWLRYDSDKLWREYKELKHITSPTEVEKSRLEDIIRQMRDVDSKIESLREK